MAITAAILVAGSTTLLGIIVGYALGRTYSNAVKADIGPPKPICMCHHNFGDHVDGRKCKVAIRNGWGDRIGNCSCQVYVGPDPVLSGHWTPSK